MTQPPSDADKTGGNTPSKPDPNEGLRLLKAFMNIADAQARADVIKLAESMSSGTGS